MAKPMTSTQLLGQLGKWGIQYKTYKNWASHNRNSKGPWGPVNGFMWHHTGSDSTDQRELLRNGYTALPGPLCQFGIAQNGIVWLIGWGRANHAGSGDPDVLGAVIGERRPPVDNETGVDGNTHFYGAEFWHSGNKPMPDVQYFAGIRLSCAINDFHDWNHFSVIGHGEWQPGKWDPGYAPGKMMNMDNVRSDVLAAFKRGPTATDKPVPIVMPKPEVYKQVWETDAMAPARGQETDQNTTWMPQSLMRYAAEQAEQARKNTEKIMAHLGIK